MVDSSVV
jgi:WD40 repeat protein